ncbi:MAG: hypothetical protein O7F76_01315 [Planctomycetota bacterium]|nr:hypothetical protein [Planctomycetota bacterium]
MPPKFDSPEFERRIMQPLRSLGRKLKRNVLLEGVCACAGLFVVVAGGHLMIDKLLHLGLGPRAALLLILIGAAGHQIWRRLLRPWSVRIGPEDMAALVERRHPELHDELISVVSFSQVDTINPRRDSPALVAAHIERSVGRIRSLAPSGVLRMDRFRRHLMVGGAALIVAVVATIAAPVTIETYVARDLFLRDVPWPSSVHLTLEGFNGRVLRWPIGDELKLVATAHDKVPDGLSAEFRSDSGDGATRTMDRQGRNQFVVDYGPLMQSMQVRLLIRRLGVDEATDWYEVEAVDRPTVQDVAVRVTPPDYTELDPFSFAVGQTSGDVLRGSAVRISAGLNKPVLTAALRTTERTLAEATFESERRIVAGFVPTRTGSCFFELTDLEGLRDIRPVMFSLRVVDDKPPTVRLTLPGVGELVLANAVPTLAVEAEDNLGLQSVYLLHTEARQSDSGVELKEAEDPLPGFVSKQTRYSRQHEWPLQPWTLRPGDEITLQVRADDFQPPGDADGNPPPGAGVSVAYTLRVVTREALLAELGRREHEWRREFEQIIKSQEQLNTRIMDVRDLIASGSPEAAVRYGPEARSQRQQAGRLKTVLTQFERILAEHRTNRIATRIVRRRLLEGVIQPMSRLINVDIIEAGELLERLRLRHDREVADELERMQHRIVQTMYGILANMLKWEGYNEAVALLQDIVRLQGDVNKETRARLEREIDRLFGSEPTTQPEDQP